MGQLSSGNVDRIARRLFALRSLVPVLQPDKHLACRVKVGFVTAKHHRWVGSYCKTARQTGLAGHFHATQAPSGGCSAQPSMPNPQVAIAPAMLAVIPISVKKINKKSSHPDGEIQRRTPNGLGKRTVDSGFRRNDG